MERYGTETYNNIELMKYTKYLKYGNPYFTNSTKAILTNIIKYGVSNYNMLDVAKDHLSNVNSSDDVLEKTKKTCIEKYGVEYINQNVDMRNNLSKKMSSFDMLYKSKLTCLIKYNDLYPVKSQEEIYNFLSKSYNTKKKNKSFNSSNIEKLLILYFDTYYFDEYIYLYYSDAYPFNCDFYIKSLDLYIEILGSWTHGHHPFNKNNINDIEILNKWKNKNSKYYENAIQTWTIRDVKKRNYAKQHKLNYLEIFSCNINECINTINNYIKIKKEES